jgi:hypothetical protein
MTESDVAQKLLGAWRTVDAWTGAVIHHRDDSIQPGDGGDLVRRFELDGERLVLRALNSTLEVTRERIK